MHRWLSFAALPAWLLLLSANAAAQPTPTTAAATAEVHRDPQGVKGISPFSELIKRGDNALLARDFEGAIVAYRDAISREPQNALGQYRLGEAQLLRGDLQAAAEAFNTGLRFVAPTNLALKAKLQFALADSSERQKAYDQAIAEWSAYEALSAGGNGSPGFSASASERKRAIAAWKKLRADTLAVKARIEKGLQAADEAVRKSSQ